MKRGALAKVLIVLAAVFALPSCGGGSGGGGIIAGIGGTGITASGTITGFGSIFVNGVEYQTGNTAVTINDTGATASELKLGMVVKVTGQLNSDGITGTATSVAYDADLKGPIVAAPTLLSNGSKSFQVLNTTVVVQPVSTVFDNSQYPGFSFNSIAQNDLVEVSGFYDANGRLYATRIGKVGVLSASTPVEIKGTISGYNNANSFTVGGLTVTLSNSTDLSQLTGGIVDGAYVEVKGLVPSATATTITATTVLPEEGTFGTDVSEASVEGIVTDYNGLSNFKVAGQTVDASTATISPTGFQIANGVQVEVGGPISAGVLKATKVEGRSGEISLTVPVYSVDTVNNSIAVRLDSRTVPITVNSRTQFEDEATGTEPFSVTDVYPNNVLEIEGVSDGAGGVIATHVKRTAVAQPVPFTATVTAPLQSLDQTSYLLRALGVTYSTDTNTVFFNASGSQVSRGTFFSTVPPGTLVHIVDDNNDGLAERVEVDN
ncbi:MAG: DUF5666 domain-containing protein [Gammaproteobacteria bacterium]